MTSRKKILLSVLSFGLVAVAVVSLSLNTELFKGQFNTNFYNTPGTTSKNVTGDGINLKLTYPNAIDWSKCASSSQNLSIKDSSQTCANAAQFKVELTNSGDYQVEYGMLHLYMMYEGEIVNFYKYTFDGIPGEASQNGITIPVNSSPVTYNFIWDGKTQRNVTLNPSGNEDGDITNTSSYRSSRYETTSTMETISYPKEVEFKVEFSYMKPPYNATDERYRYTILTLNQGNSAPIYLIDNGIKNAFCSNTTETYSGPILPYTNTTTNYEIAANTLNYLTNNYNFNGSITSNNIEYLDILRNLVQVFNFYSPHTYEINLTSDFVSFYNEARPIIEQIPTLCGSSNIPIVDLQAPNFNPLDKPIIISPESNETNVSTTPEIIWTEVSGATNYSVKINNSSAHLGTSCSNSLFCREGILGDRITIPSTDTLNYFTEYRLVVSARDNEGNVSSDFQLFTTKPTPNPVCVYLDTNNTSSLNTSATGTISFTDNRDALVDILNTLTLDYNVEGTFGSYSTTALSMISDLLDGIIDSGSYTLTHNVENVSYPTAHSQALAILRKAEQDCKKASSYISPITYTVPSALGQPNITYPQDGATNVSRTPEIKWTAATGATNYSVRINDLNTNIDTPCTESLFCKEGITGTSFVIPVADQLALNTDYRLTVTAKDNSGNSTADFALFKTIESTPPPSPFPATPLNIEWQANSPFDPVRFASTGNCSYPAEGYVCDFLYNQTYTVNRKDKTSTGVNIGQIFKFQSNYANTDYALRLYLEEGTTKLQKGSFGDGKLLLANTNENIEWNELCGTTECPDPIGAEKYFLELVARKDINNNGTVDIGEQLTYKAYINFDKAGATPPPAPTEVSCSVNYTISNTTNTKFDPDTEKVKITYNLDSEDTLKYEIKAIGPVDPTATDPLNSTTATKVSLSKGTIDKALLPTSKNFDWAGVDAENAVLEDGYYVIVIEASDSNNSNNTSQNYDCRQIRSLFIEHTGGTTQPIMEISAKKTLVPFREEQLVTFKNNVEATKVVINLYKDNETKPIATAYYYCGPNEDCPTTKTTNLSPGSRTISVPYQYFSESGKYYFKASLKTKAGKIYKISSNKFAPETSTNPIANCNFADVNPTDPRYSDIVRVCELGIMIGSPSPANPNQRVFYPFQVMNRIEGITISNRLSLCPDLRYQARDGDLGFRDMQPYVGLSNATWMFDEIKKGLLCLRLTGYADGTIKPAQQLNNAEAWKIVLEAVQNSGLGRYSIFANLGKNPWWTDYEFFLVQTGFRLPQPAMPITRAEVASFIVELERKGLIQFLDPSEYL